MTDYSNRPTLTEEQARQCLPLVQSWLNTVAPGAEAALYPPGHETRHWNISCEGTDLDCWPAMISSQVTWPEGITTEATNHFSLALFPDAIAAHIHRAAQHGITLHRSQFRTVDGFLTIDGTDADDWINTMTMD